MKQFPRDDLIIKESDYQKLIGLIERLKTPTAELLEREMSRAEVIQDDLYPEDAVCMGSKVRFVDLHSDKGGEVTLVFPGEANIHDMKISILTPMGSALIGMRVNGMIDWKMPNGQTSKIQILATTCN